MVLNDGECCNSCETAAGFVIYLGVVLNESADVGRPSLMATLRRAEHAAQEMSRVPGIIFVTYNDPFGGLGCDRTGPRGRQCREQLKPFSRSNHSTLYLDLRRVRNVPVGRRSRVPRHRRSDMDTYQPYKHSDDRDSTFDAPTIA